MRRARRSLSTRGFTGYKNVKQPTGLSKEVRWGSFGGGTGLGRGPDPALQRALALPSTGILSVCKREGGDPEKEVDRLLGLGELQVREAGESSGAQISRVRLLGAWHCQLPKAETSTGHLGQPLLSRPGDGGAPLWGRFTIECFTRAPAMAL